MSEAKTRARTGHVKSRSYLSALADAGVYKQTCKEKAQKKNQQECVFPNIYTSRQKPDEMSWQTDHTFKFKYKVQMFH